MTITLSDQQLASIDAQSAQAKSLVKTYLLWFFLGWLGLHRIYLHRNKTGAAQALLFLVNSSEFFGPQMSTARLVLFGLTVAWWLLDAILLPRMLTSYRLDLKVRLIDERSHPEREAMIDTSKWSEHDRQMHALTQRLRQP